MSIISDPKSPGGNIANSFCDTNRIGFTDFLNVPDNVSYVYPAVCTSCVLTNKLSPLVNTNDNKS